MLTEDAVAKVLQGLLDIAHTAMPDSYFASDSRVNAAKAMLYKIKGHPYTPSEDE